jgi:hypothetical protein
MARILKKLNNAEHSLNFSLVLLYGRSFCRGRGAGARARQRAAVDTARTDRRRRHHQVGRLLEGLKKLGILDDTLVYYIIGDNGASAEGTLNGAYNEMANFNGLAALETPEFLMERYDKLGGPESYNHYAVGWPHAMNTPYQWTKQVASHWGGTRNGTIVGEDAGAPVSPDYGSRGNAFNGTVKGVQLAIADAAESADHLVSPEEAIRIAMARQ